MMQCIGFNPTRRNKTNIWFVIFNQNTLTLQEIRQKRKKEDIMEMMGVTKFLRRPPIYLMLYGFATARRDEHPKEPWPATIREFKKRFGIHDEIECEEMMYRQVFLMTADLLNEGI